MHIQSQFPQLMSLPSFVLYSFPSLLDCSSRRTCAALCGRALSWSFSWIPCTMHSFLRFRSRFPWPPSPTPTHDAGRMPAPTHSWLPISVTTVPYVLVPFFVPSRYIRLPTRPRHSTVDHAHPVDAQISPSNPHVRNPSQSRFRLAFCKLVSQSCMCTIRSHPSWRLVRMSFLLVRSCSL